MRFSLRSLFVYTAFLGVYRAIVFAVPAMASYICLLLATLTMCPVIVTGVVYDSGYSRTFWIGCAASGMIPLLAMMTCFSFGGGFYLPIYNVSDEIEERLFPFILAGSHGFVVLSGGVASLTRWLLECKNWTCRTDAAFDESIWHGCVTVAELHSSRDRE